MNRTGVRIIIRVSAFPAAASRRKIADVTTGSGLLAREDLLPVSEALSSLLPFGGLKRGGTTLIGPGKPGGTSLAVELLSGLSQAGHWCAAVGLADLGLVAASEGGIALERFILVPSPGHSPRWEQVLATLFEAVPAVLFAPAGPVKAPQARKVAARAREKRTALVLFDPRGCWPEAADLRLEVTSSSWSGLGEGCGLLAGRSIEIEIKGKGAAARPRRGCLTPPAKSAASVDLRAVR